MISPNGRQSLASTIWKFTVSSLLMLAMLACNNTAEDSKGDPEASLTPPPGMFSILPTTESSVVGDDPTLELNLDTPEPTFTPEPTLTPIPTLTPEPAPTATPLPTATSTPTVTPGPTVADGLPSDSGTGPAVQFTVPKKTELKHPKAGSEINRLVARVEAGEISAEDAAQEAPLHQGDSVGATIYLSGNVDAVVAFLEANGASNISSGEDYIEAYVPFLLLAETSERPGVLRVRVIQPPESPQSDSRVAGDGPAVHGSTAWNQEGYTGKGIKVGVIDGGFGRVSELMGTEVPATVQVRCYPLLGQHSQNLADCGSNTHGTAVSESIMDIAPDVSLYITNPDSLTDLKDAVDWMISGGVSVINASRLWEFDGPGDGTSPLSISPLNILNTAVAAGTVWVNAAGNQAEGTWFKRGPFTYTMRNVDGEDIKYINFSGSDFENLSSLGGYLELRWEDSWGGATRDLDLFLVNPENDQDTQYRSVDLQSGEPEYIPYEAIRSHARRNVLVAHRSGSEPAWIQLLGWKRTRLEFNNAAGRSGAGSIVNPAESANPGMLAVGATRWDNLKAVEPFSSQGPTPYGRVKPDVVGADCGETSVDSSFCGTSQAAPHVTGMVALVRQRLPEYTPDQVVAYLKDNAAPMRITRPDPNNVSGHGFAVLPEIGQSTASLPGAPAIEDATPAQSSMSITMSWTPPSQTGGSPITAYDLRHIRNDAASKVDANWTVVPDVPTGSGRPFYTLTGMPGGTRYDLQVRAANAVGDGPWSATFTVTTTSTVIPPGAPGNLTTIANGQTRIDLSWRAPSDDGGTVITGYRIEVSEDNSNWSDLVANTRSTATRYSHIGLTAGLTRHYRVSAINSAGAGPASNVSTGTTTGVALTSPCATEGAVQDPANNPELVADCEALLAARDTLRGTANLNWSATTPIGDWDGVGTGFTPTRVTSVSLFRQGLTGTIPPGLGNLDGLLNLNLENNQLAGTIPSALGRLTDLRDMRLGSNKLTGVIPPELGGLERLRYLYIPHNQLTGGIPGKLGDLESLQELELRDNQLTGSIPEDIGNLTSLRGLWLADNRFTGMIPKGLGQLSNLRELNLIDNQLSGAIPAELGSLAALEHLHLTGNQLSGCIPTGLRDVPDNDLGDLGLHICGEAAEPGTPTGLSATSSSQTEINLSWQAPASDGGPTITGYRIEVSSNRSSWSDLVVNTDSSSTSYTHTGLTAGSTRHYRVSAINSVGTGTASSTATGNTVPAGAPDAPSIGSVTTGDSSLAVSWSTPGRSGGSAITAYDLRHIRSDATNKADANWTVVQNVWTGSGALTYELTGLANGTRYDMQVRAVNAAGDGPWSATAAGTTIATLPDAPSGLTSATNSQTQIDLSWRAPSNYGGAAITGYRIEVSEDNSNWSDLVANTRSTATRYSHIGLTAGLTRHYRVSAINSAGAGSASNTASATTESMSAPDLVVDTPTVDNNSPTAGVSLTLRATVRNQGNGSSASTTLRYYQSTDSTITTSDAEVDTDFVFRLNASGTGDESVRLTAPSTPGTYYYGACVDSVSDELDIQNNCSSGVVVTVGAAPAPDLMVDRPTLSDGAPDAGARFTLSATVRNQGNGSSASTTLRYYQSTDSTITTSDAEVDTDFVFRLNASETGDESVSLTAPSTPGTYYYGACVDSVSDESDIQNNCSSGVVVAVSASASVASSPTGLTATANSQTQIDLSWRVPSSGGGAAITGYRIEISEDGSNWSNLVADTRSTATRYSHISLTAGTTRHYRVSAINSAGMGAASNVATATTESVAAEPSPSSPANAKYRREGSTTVVTWDASAGATYYKVYYDDFGSPRCSLLSSGRPSGCDELAANVARTTYTHTSPDEDTNYYWITACNSAGCSDIDSANPAEFIDNRPDAPANAKYRREGSTTVVTWAASAGATHYKVYYHDFFDSNCKLSSGRPSFCDELATNVAGTTYTHTSPDEDTNYYWITACNNAGCSDIDSANPAQLIVQAPTVTMPGAPTGLTATGSSQTQIDLSWRAPSDDGGAAITGYRLEVSTNGSSWNDLVADTRSASTSYSHSGLTADSTRHYRVSAINSDGTGTASNVATATTESQANSAPKAVGTIPEQVITPRVEITIDVSPYFSDSDRDDLSYSVDSPTLFNRLSVSGSTITMRNDFVLCEPTTVRVTAQDDGGLEDTQQFTVRRSNNPPVASSDTFPPQTIDVGESTSPLYLGNWFSDPDTCDSRLTYMAASSDASKVTASASGNTVTIAGASAGNATVTVTAQDTGGLEATLDIQVTVTATETTSKPGAPTGLTATADGQTQIDLSWSAPSDDGGADITGYKIEVSINGSSWSGLVANTGSTATTYSHTNLTAGSTQYYRVSAINSAGTGAVSNVDSATTGASTAPDLKVDTPTVSHSNPTAGASFMLNATVRNQGNGSSESTTLRYYRSSDSTITTSDTEVGTDAVSRLDASESGDESLNLTALSTPGTYYYGACVDSVSSESDTANNCSPAVAVTVAAAPDPEPAPPQGQYKTRSLEASRLFRRASITK